MKKGLFSAVLIIMTVGFYSCQKDRLNRSSVETDLYTSVAEITGIQVNALTGSDEHSLSVEKYDGHSPAYVIQGISMGDNKIPGWNVPMGHLKFGVPHVDSCATVTVSGTTYPKEIVVEYLKGCSTHKHDRYGKVYIVLTDTITKAGAVQTITYEDFYIDSMKVDLSATLKNLGQNANGNWVIEKSYTQTLEKNGETCVRESDETQEWLSGFGTTDIKDDKYYLTGSGSVVVNDTAVYSRKIIKALVYDASCEFITSGVVEMDRNGNTTTIDYGDGTCDNTATVTAADGTTQEINLKSHHFMEGDRPGRHHHGFGNKE